MLHLCFIMKSSRSDFVQESLIDINNISYILHEIEICAKSARKVGITYRDVAWRERVGTPFPHIFYVLLWNE